MVIVVKARPGSVPAQPGLYPLPERAGMDYQRIYREFIADRKSKPKPEGYTERHHILPRSLGGGDESANLIYLSARDHYFAHCCLAKIHGGKMWSALFAVAAMAKKDASWRYFCRRRMVQSSRIMAAQRRSENMKELWASGEFKRVRTYRPISEAHRARLRELGRGRKMPKEAIEKMRATKSAKAEVFQIRHSDGRHFTGTQYDFRAYSGLSQSMVSYLCRGKILTAKGWFLNGTNLKMANGRDPQVRVMLHKDGAVFKGTRSEFLAAHPNVDNGSLSKLLAGKLGTVKGWRVNQEN